MRISFPQAHTSSNTSLRFQSEACSEQMIPLLSSLLNIRTQRTGTSTEWQLSCSPSERSSRSWALAAFEARTLRNTVTAATPLIGKHGPLEVSLFQYPSRRRSLSLRPWKLTRSLVTSNTSAAHFPTDLIYAVRVSRYPDSKWTFDVGTGHLGATVAQGLNIKVNNAIAIAADFRF